MTSPITEERRTTAVPTSRSLERMAQRLYDFRDSCPSADDRTWKELDAVARRLGRLGARLGA